MTIILYLFNILSRKKDQRNNTDSLLGCPKNPISLEKAIHSILRLLQLNFPRKLFWLSATNDNFVGVQHCTFVQFEIATMERVCKRCTKKKQRHYRGREFSLDVNCCLPIWDDDEEKRDKNEGEACVLTFIVVIPFRPICCHETAQSGSTHVPTARPLINLEQSRVISKWFWREIFGNCVKGSKSYWR